MKLINLKRANEIADEIGSIDGKLNILYGVTNVKLINGCSGFSINLEKNDPSNIQSAAEAFVDFVIKEQQRLKRELLEELEKL